MPHNQTLSIAALAVISFIGIDSAALAGQIDESSFREVITIIDTDSRRLDQNEAVDGCLCDDWVCRIDTLDEEYIDEEDLSYWLEQDPSFFEIDDYSVGEHGESIVTLRSAEGEIIYLIQLQDGTTFYGIPTESGEYIFCIYYEDEDGEHLIPIAEAGDELIELDSGAELSA
jgi:hypothetical protein